MWTPPADEVVQNSGWTPPADERVDQGSEKPSKSVGGLMSNALSDTGSIVGGLAQAALHPVDTATNVATHLPEIGHGMLHSWGLDTQDSGHRMQTLADESYEHPVSHVLDAASLAIPGLKAAGLAPKALEGVNVASKIAEGADEASNALGRRALGFTKGITNKIGLDKANEATKYALDNGVVTAGASPREMQLAAEGAHELEGNKIGEVLKKEPGTFDQSSAAQRLEALRPKGADGKVLTGGDYDALNAQIDRKLATIGAHGENPIGWEAANKLKKDIRGGTNFTVGADDNVNALRKKMGGTFKDELDSQLKTSMEGRGADITPFLESKKNYGHLENLDKALENKVNATSGNRLVGLTDTIAGAAGATVGGGIGAGATILAKQAIEKFGLTGGAVLARKLARIGENPALLQKYGAVIDKAIAGGPAAVATTVHLIEQHDPTFPQGPQ